MRTVEPASAVPVNTTVALFSCAFAAGVVITGAAGAAVSTVNVWVAGEASVLPAGAIARTANERRPSASAAVVNGDEQRANAPPSTLHSNVEPASVDPKLN